MFTAYPDQNRPRCVRKLWLLSGCAIGSLALLVWAEKFYQEKRQVNVQQSKNTHFLQPFLYSPGFEVGLWTWHRGVTKSPEEANDPSKSSTVTADLPATAQQDDIGSNSEDDTSDQPTAKKADQQLSVAEVEVGRLRAELEAERQRSALQREELDRLAGKANVKNEKAAKASTQDQPPEPKKEIPPPKVETRGNELAEVGEKVRIPSSLFRQPPTLEASSEESREAETYAAPATEKKVSNQDSIGAVASVRSGREETPSSVAVEVGGKSGATQAAQSVTEAQFVHAKPTPSAQLEEAPAAKQPTITLKAGGSEIHVKIGDDSSVPQQQVQTITKEESAVLVTAAPTATDPTIVAVVTTTLPPIRSAERPSSGISPRAEAFPASTTTTTIVASDVAPGAGTAVEANRGTSITLKSQGQTITIQFDSGGKDKNEELVQPSASVALPVQQSTALLAPKPTEASALIKQLPEPIGTPAPQVLSIPSAVVNPSLPERSIPTEQINTDPPKVVFTIATTTTTTSEVTTSLTEPKDEDRYANLALRAR